MRHRSDQDHDHQGGTQGGSQLGTQSAQGSTLVRQTTLAPAPGRHRAPGVTPALPLQKQPIHDATRAVAAPVRIPVVPAQARAPRPVQQPVQQPVQLPVQLPAQRRIQQPAQQPAVPLAAQWKASHLPRTLAATVLGLAALGTAGLGVRYAETSTSDNLVSLAIGLAVVVVLWGVLIASTPQVVSLDGSVLTVHNLGGLERFDLADALQPVDVVGNPRTAYWAVLLHRANGTTLVLRHNDVVATELDPIVRHYRMVADQRSAERQARFNL